MFDLPTTTIKEKKEYIRFRKMLLKEGFIMFQYSVYVRICVNRSQADNYVRKLEKECPEYGLVRALYVTEKQFAEMPLLLGNMKLEETVLNHEQLTLW